MNVQRTKLTRKAFEAFQPFTFLVSCLCRGGFDDPVFAEHVEAEEPARREQWRRIVKARASQRDCMLFINKQQYLNFLEKFRAREQAQARS